MEKKARISKWLVLCVIIISLGLLFGFVQGTVFIFWFLAILNLFFGPVCLILYLIEVKNGVFANTEEDSEI